MLCLGISAKGVRVIRGTGHPEGEAVMSSSLQGMVSGSWRRAWLRAGARLF